MTGLFNFCSRFRRASRAKPSDGNDPVQSNPRREWSPFNFLFGPLSVQSSKFRSTIATKLTRTIERSHGKIVKRRPRRLSSPFSSHSAASLSRKATKNGRNQIVTIQIAFNSRRRLTTYLDGFVHESSPTLSRPQARILLSAGYLNT